MGDNMVEQGATQVRMVKNGLLNVSAPIEIMEIAKRNNTESPLLRLPAEIRNKIWSYVLGGHKIDIYIKVGRRRSPHIKFKTLPVKLLVPPTYVNPDFRFPRVCRQLYADTSLLVYSLNTFSFLSARVMDHWLAERQQGQLNSLTSIDVPHDYMWDYIDETRLLFRQIMPGIKRIIVDGWVANACLMLGDRDEDMKARFVEQMKEWEGQDFITEFRTHDKLVVLEDC